MAGALHRCGGARAADLANTYLSAVASLIQDWRARLAEAGVLLPLSGGRRNRSWEAVGLLDLIADLEAGHVP